MNREEYISFVTRNLKGELTDTEFDQLNQMTASSSEFMDLRISIEDAWDASGGEQEVLVTPKETRELFDSIATSQDENKNSTSSSTRSLYRWIASAAAILLLLFTTMWLMDNGPTQFDKAGQYALADGTQVTLREGSHLDVVEWSSSKRHVSMKGEVFFEVFKNSTPFIVDANQVKVHVLGTTFLIKESKGKTYVDLLEGRIECTNKTNKQSKKMTAGMRDVHYKDGRIESVDRFKNLSSWAKGTFTYNNEKLGEAIEELSIIYGKDILLDKKELSECTFSGVINAEDLDELLMAIQKQFRMTRSASDDNIILEGGSCE